jgi:phosphate starvation-inducible PhoH-like protein
MKYQLKIQAKATTAPKLVPLKPRNVSQAKYIKLLDCPKTHIVIATGIAGAGKTMLAVCNSMEKLISEECKKLIITRPMISVENKDFGALPGDLFSKTLPYMLPIYDNMYKYISPKQVKNYIEDNTIEVCPLIHMRGRSFENTIVIADEMQNCTVAQMKMLLTRIGQNSKFIVNGDVSQSDLSGNNGESGLDDILEKLYFYPVDGIEHVEFTEDDVERHQIIKKILKLYSNDYLSK